MSIQNNLLGCLPDFQFNGNGALIAESTAELKIVNRDVIIDRLDPKYVSNPNQPISRSEAKTSGHLQLECPSVARCEKRVPMCSRAKAVELNGVVNSTLGVV